MNAIDTCEMNDLDLTSLHLSIVHSHFHNFVHVISPSVILFSASPPSSQPYRFIKDRKYAHVYILKCVSFVHHFEYPGISAIVTFFPNGILGRSCKKWRASKKLNTSPWEFNHMLCTRKLVIIVLFTAHQPIHFLLFFSTGKIPFSIFSLCPSLHTCFFPLSVYILHSASVSG